MPKILQTPSIEAVSAFDSHYDSEIFFLYSDNQPIRNRAVIKDNSTGTIVYDRTTDSMKLVHVIPKDSLLNGKQYLIQVQVYDSDGNSSLLSDAVLFYCSSTPNFSIKNIVNGATYKNASIKPELSYSQNEGESLKSYSFLLYDHQKSLVKKSEIMYSDLLSYTFYGLENQKVYYLKCIGETEHGFQLDTDYIEVLVKYDTIPANVVFQIDNNRNSGYITLKSNITDIGYELKNNNYIIHDGALTLTDNWLKYNSGFKVDKDFVLFIEAKKLPLGTFLKTADGEFTLSIIKFCDKYYCKFTTCDIYVIYCELPGLQITTSNNEVIVTSDGKRLEILSFGYKDDAFVVFEVRKVADNFSLKAYYKENYLEMKE